MLKFANESMNELVEKKKAMSRHRYSYFTPEHAKKNERTNDFTVRLQCRRKERIHKYTQCLLSRFYICACVWESVRVKVKFTATTTTPAPRVRFLPTRCVRDERWKSTEFAGKHRGSDVCAGDFDLTCLTSSWAQSSASAAQQQSGFGSAACNSLAFNCLGVASHDHYLSAAQLHYEQRVCERERGRVWSHYNEPMTNLW